MCHRTEGHEGRTAETLAGQRPLWLVMVAVAVVALAVRAVMVANSGGLAGIVGYDQGVYYSASEAVAWGVLPYRDFLFLHPPGSSSRWLRWGWSPG